MQMAELLLNSGCAWPRLQLPALTLSSRVLTIMTILSRDNREINALSRAVFPWKWDSKECLQNKRLLAL